MTSPVRLWPAASTTLKTGGTSQRVFFGPLESGARLYNPPTESDQAIPVVEVLYVSLIGPAGLAENGTTFAVQPGQWFSVPRGQALDVWINAATTGHSFSAIVPRAPTDFMASRATFPPSRATSLTKAIPSYLYEEYADDEDLQAFRRSFNEIAQAYVDWFANVGLPVYTGPLVEGALLDWVALGLYGIVRPVLPSGKNRNVGEYNTFVFNELAFNDEVVVSPTDFYATTDDVFKRILTWHLYKGDGKTFNIRWLKRRIMRFLFGVDGTDYDDGETYIVSVSFGLGNQVNIGIARGTRTIVGGAIYNEFAFNEAEFNGIETTFVPSPGVPMAVILKAAIDAGVLELPFQFTYVVNVG